MATISSLPTEMLAHIFSFLDAPAPSDLRLHDQPKAHMFKNPNISSQNLKNLSLVSHQWRATVLPLLFRHAVLYLDNLDLARIEQARAEPGAIPLLPFVRANHLKPYIHTLTLVVAKSTRGRPVDGAVALHPPGEGSGHYPHSAETAGPLSLAGGEKDVAYYEDSNWLWDLLFDVVDPLRFTIVVSPRMLASLLARMLFLGDEWSFSQSHHLLSLSRSGRTPTTLSNAGVEPQQKRYAVEAETALSSTLPASASTACPPRRVPCSLFTIRAWDAILLNEGSSTRVYKTYEYFHKRPPSVLGALLGAEGFPNDEPLIPPSVRELSYVAIFPLSSHFNTLVQNLPRIDRLFVQLVPRNDILDDRREMEHLDME
ncbi:hypothetical protein SLS53_003564 [Cytospora paraplurivora]|uniref:F-box domain-containing protein n=1 Tax=Cytospora paraplurivora TaxID=2898453 RepID=A0AAN9UAT4_9PEZI